MGELVDDPAAVPFGDLLRGLRARAGLTQEELAEAARLSHRSISDLERGVNRTARKETARLLAEALRLTGGARATARRLPSPGPRTHDHRKRAPWKASAGASSARTILQPPKRSSTMRWPSMSAWVPPSLGGCGWCSGWWAGARGRHPESG